VAGAQDHHLQRPFRAAPAHVPPGPPFRQPLLQHGAGSIHGKHKVLDDLLHGPAMRPPAGMHGRRRRIEPAEFIGKLAVGGLEDWVHLPEMGILQAQ
jgi:hypothetical protein